MPTAKILIVGQGLAGSILADKLMSNNYQVSIIDKGHKNISSSIAAGVINPVTGRRIVKSWMIDELLPVAKEYYHKVAQELKIDLWHELPAIRIFTDIAMSNNWGVRMEHEGYQKYLNFAQAKDLENYPLTLADGAGIIHHSARANISLMIRTLRQKWLTEGRLSEMEFNFDALSIKNTNISYQGESYDKVIFCEGWEAQQNPLFPDLPFQVSKGEVLILRLPNMPQERIIKRKVAFVPLGEHLFWVGATNFWTFENSLPSEEGENWLQSEIDAVLTEPYEIVDHQSAIRPTVKNRRPLIGFPTELEANKQAAKIGIFNGFGTKGTSLVPFWADRFLEQIEEIGWMKY